jgi:hypothetical protein
VKNVIGLAVTIRTQDHLVLLRRERIGDDRQRLIVDLDGFGAIHGCRARLGKHGGNFLVLEQHLAHG